MFVQSAISLSAPVCFLDYMLRVMHVAWYKSAVHDKGKPAVRRGRKATELRREVAGLPRGGWLRTYRVSDRTDPTNEVLRKLWGVIAVPEFARAGGLI